jgi:Holliday junction resolvasome RuvABC DNA-binding subunit
LRLPSSRDERFLATLPGIGKARARQIIAALQDRLSRDYSPASPGIEGDAWAEARLVLSQIGIPAQDADQLLSRARTSLSGNESPTSSEIVREAMRARSPR